MDNIQKIQQLQTIDYQGYIYDLQRSLAFSKDDALMAVSDKQGLSVWRTTDWTVLETLESGEGYRPGPVAFSPDSSFIASGGSILDAETPFHIWRVAGGLPLAEPEIPAQDLAFSPDGRLLAASDGNRIRIFLLEKAVMVAELELTGGEVLAGPIFSPGGKFLAAGNSERMHVWDVSGCVENTSPCGNLALENLVPTNRFERYLAFSSDDAWVVYNGQALPLLQNSEPLREFGVMKYWLPKEGHLLAYPQLERYRFAFLNLDTGATLFNQAGWQPGYCPLCPFSADGSLYVHTGRQEADGLLFLSFMAVKSGKEVYTKKASPALAAHFFSPSGLFLLVVEQVEQGNWDKFTIQMWGLVQ